MIDRQVVRGFLVPFALTVVLYQAAWWSYLWLPLGAHDTILGILWTGVLVLGVAALIKKRLLLAAGALVGMIASGLLLPVIYAFLPD